MAGYRSLRKSSTLIVATVFLLLNLNRVSSKNKTIHILCLLPYPDPQLKADRNYGAVISMALELAQEQINSQTEPLPDHRIELIQDDSGCEYTTSTKIDLVYESFVRNIQFHREKLVGIIGPDCTSSSLAIAPLLNHKEISLVAVHGGVSPLLSDRTRYPYALGALASSENFITLAINFKQQANWTKVGILLDESRLYLQTDNLVNIHNQMLNNLNIDISFLSITALRDSLSLIVDEGVCVSFLFTSAANTQRLLCMAKHCKMVYDTYQWIVVTHLLEDIAQDVFYSTHYGKTNYFCSESDMRKSALNGVLFLNNRLSPLNKPAPIKLNFNDYEQQLRNRINVYNSQYGYNITYSPWNTYYYDSLWAWAVALDSLTRQNLSVDPTSYGSNRRVLSDLIIAELYDLNFEGVSGRVNFDNSSGFLTQLVSVTQCKDAELKLVTTFDGKELVQYLNIAYIPDTFEDQAFGISDTQAIVFGIITAIELTIIVALHILTIKYRNLPAVKASSYKLNQLAYLGCYLFSIAIFLTIPIWYPSSIGKEILCMIKWTWLLPFSYTLIFGTLSVKTWRLYNIFFHYLKPSRYLKNHYLVLVVVSLLLIDMIIGIIWTSLNSFHIVLRNDTITDGVTKFLVIQEVCLTENWQIWYGLAYGYRVLFLVAIIILAVLTYRIPNPSFSTRTLRILIFLFTIVIVSGLSIFHFLLFNSTGPTLAYWFSEIITFNLILALFIALLFTPPLIPKLKELKQHALLRVKCVATEIASFFHYM